MLPSISKSRWTYALHDDSKAESLEKMRRFRFDVLPIRSSDGSYRKCFKTIEWGIFTIGNIVEHRIGHDDCLDQLTKIENVIEAFAEKERNYFFLRDRKEITGLINISDLNSKQVYVFAYNLIASLELAMGRLINESGFDDSELIRIFESNNKSVKPLVRYRREIKKNLDHKFIECAYLGDMAWIIIEKKLFRKIKISKNEFESSVKLINKLRNISAHPVNSLIKGRSSVIELNQAVSRVRIIMKEINDYLKERC